MATRKRSPKKDKLEDLATQDDPRAALDAALLLRSAQPVLKALAADLLARAKGSPALTKALEARHQKERDGERTAEPFDVWLRAFVEQVAAAWLLSCVFVRVLEDRGLVEQNRLAGPGALDSQQLFFELAPSLSERDYLLTVFRELSELPAASALFDAHHNPVWLLSPSAEGARALLALFRSPSPHAPALRFGQADTRFLGDLYQDLSEDVRKRFALLQTPHFVESFILDRSLEPAIQRFGLNETTLIDPTCGSGHFLLGGFERLLEHRLRTEPGLDVRKAALKALDAVSGADINPYAVAIARFRLTLAYLEKAGHARLKDAPSLPIHLAVADSLLHNPQGKLEARGSTDGAQMRLGEQEGLEKSERAAFEGELYALEDERAAREVLYRRYTVVVGNPPYITVKDSVLRERYRQMYPRSAAGKYAVCAPFTERFFQLARSGGSVGMITANSFMKREFGKKLIEEFLPGVNLEVIVNTSGAYIPGHGTPTVLLFGTSEDPQSSDVLTVLAKRGEPTTPNDPEKGHVWSSIAGHWDELGFENDYISVANTTREHLAKHPWSLGGGGAAELKALLEQRAEKRLGDVATAIGFDAIMGEDELFFGPADWLHRLGLSETHQRLLCTGEQIRDWAIATQDSVVFPYDETSLEPQLPTESVAAQIHFWKYRQCLIERRQFGKNTVEAGLQWFEYRSFYKSKRSTPLSIAFAFVATHNHFVLDRGGKVFNRSAPIIKLPEGATEDDHLALLAYLNSSTACFWMKQVSYPKGGSGIGRGIQDEDWESRFEFDGTKLASLPIPRLSGLFSAASRTMEQLARDREQALRDADRASYDTSLRRMCAIQEELDWLIYEMVGLLATEQASASGLDLLEQWCLHDRPIDCTVPGQRPFESVLIKAQPTSQWFVRNNYEPLLADASVASSEQTELYLLRRRIIEENHTIGLLERPEFKRRWGVVNWEHNAAALRAEETLARLERAAAKAGHILTLRDLTQGDTSVRGDPPTDAVPFLAAYRYTDAGLEKRAAWERTWDLQRREDAGEKLDEIPVPPKYDSKDFRSDVYWRLRGKLDVPKERFISYPGCESDEDKEPLYGWAGWDHLQQAQALAGLYEQRKSEGWQAARLTPLLAGILELLPWLKQWHNEPNAEYDGQRLGNYFEEYLDSECARHGLSREDLRAWRPEGRQKRG